MFCTSLWREGSSTDGCSVQSFLCHCPAFATHRLLHFDFAQCRLTLSASGKVEEDGPFLNDNKEMAEPPWTSLRELEHASLKFEEDNPEDPEYIKWLTMLIAPGSSLSGARPKASVVDADGNLWIAKFPCRNDEKDVAAWEMVANQLAINAGLNIAEGKLQKFNNNYYTYLTKRFD